MPFSPSDLEKQCRGAIALNNLGTSLLERHCYRQAHDVFRDAVVLMRAVSRAVIEDLMPKNLECCTISRKLHKASIYLANPKSSACRQCIQVLTFDDKLSSLTSALRLHYRSDVSCPIRIETNDIEGVSGFDRDCISAICVYNYGLAQVLVAKTAFRSTVRHDKEMLLSGIQVLQLSKTILSVCRNDEGLSGIIFLGIIILHSLSQAFYDSGRIDDTKVAVRKLACLRTAAMMGESWKSHTETESTAAAA